MKEWNLSYESEHNRRSHWDFLWEIWKRASNNVQVTRQTVMNTIRRLGNVENDEAEIPLKKRVVKTLYIEADEDHVALQNGRNKEIKLIYVHEGKDLNQKADTK